MGGSDALILRQDVLPNVLGHVVVVFTFEAVYDQKMASPFAEPLSPGGKPLAGMLASPERFTPGW